MAADCPHILTAEQVAARLRVSVSLVYKLANNGTIPGFKVGKLWRFKNLEISNYIHSQEQQQCQQTN